MKKNAIKTPIYAKKLSGRTMIIATGILLLTLVSGSALALRSPGSSASNTPNNTADQAQTKQTESSNGSTSTADIPYNAETFKETFIANCVIQAKTNLSEAAANTYCTCVLDQGIKAHGIRRFIEINLEVAQTYDMSELKDIINSCAAKATTV